MRERVRQVHGELTIESNALGTGFPLLFQPRHFRLRDRRDSTTWRCLMRESHRPRSKCRKTTFANQFYNGLPLSLTQAANEAIGTAHFQVN